MIDAKKWCERSLMAVFSLWNEETGNHHAWRTSKSTPGSGNQAEEYFPTATFHAIAAFENCGAWLSRDSYNKEKRALTTPDLEVPDVENFSHYDDVLDTLVTRVRDNPPAVAPPPADKWVEAVLGASSHSPKEGQGGTASQPPGSGAKKTAPESWPRQAIVLGHMFQALRILVDHAVREKADLREILESGQEQGKELRKEKRKQYQERVEKLERLLLSVRGGFHRASEYLCDVVRRKDIGAGRPDVATASELSESPHIAPFVLLMVATGVAERDVILRRLSLDSAPFRTSDFVDAAGLCGRLKGGKDSLSEYLRDRLTPGTRQLLERYRPPRKPSENLLSALADELGGMLRGDSLYEAQRFAGVQLSEEAGTLSARGPQGEDLLLLNRILLEEAYPDEIARGLNLYRESIEPETEYESSPKMAREIRKLREVMGHYFAHELDRLMSRRQIPLYPHYDAASLAFSMHGRVLMDETFRRSPLFRACVQAIVDDQNADGTWPVGRSATFDDTGTSIQQPSIAVALSLAECIFRPELLRDSRSEQVEVLKIGLEALRKMGQNLSLSFASTIRYDGKPCYGWVSDRVRWPQVSETWITAMAARVFYILWLAERVCARDEMLSKYGVRRGEGIQQADVRQQNKMPAKAANEVNLLKAWKKEVVDPDIEAKPADTLVKKVLEPIQKQLDEELNFIRPDGDGVSFIIFGPPGSGKTFFVETFAKVLGWPLLTLNPGHFIRKGLELIEATSSEIFSDLLNLDHVVVFFDECDELFRTRQEEASGRNILSFATASMLPKLQALHDARRVIFFLGTNYLHKVDDAIRRPGRFDDTLFFDRPDETARRELILKIWKGKKGESEPLDEDVLKQAVADTTGWMIKEVINYAKALTSGRERPPSPNIDDYVDWCLLKKRKEPPVGDKELDASRLEAPAKRRIRARWKQLKRCEDARKKQQSERNERIAGKAGTPSRH